MRPRSHPNSVPATLRVLAAVAAGASVAGSVVACGLSLDGLAPLSGGPTTDASLLDSAAPGPTSDASIVGAVDGGGPREGFDSAIGDSAPLGDAVAAADADAAVDAAPTCVPFDGGASAFALSSFVVSGAASFNENSDGHITLTNSDTDQAGAAWYPTKMPDLAGYDLTWSLRVGPDETAGDGITFAVLASGGVPGVGGTGEGLGLQSISSASGDGGIPSGYAVDVDMFKDSDDPTDLGATTLKLLTMPGFKVVAETLVPPALNDGNIYAVDVSWRAPSSLTATLHGPGGALITVTSSDPGLTAPSAYFGFTAATGSSSDSHNEIAGMVVTDTCE